MPAKISLELLTTAGHAACMQAAGRPQWSGTPLRGCIALLSISLSCQDRRAPGVGQAMRGRVVGVELTEDKVRALVHGRH